MELFIILAAVVIFACIILNKISHKLGIPMLLAFIVLSLMEGKNSLSMNLYVIFAQVVYGGVCGIIIAYFASKFLKKHNFATDGFDTIFVFAVALLSYAIPSLIGGNGYLCVYLVGIILGNSKLKNKKALVHFFDGVTALMQMLIFFLLGLLSFPGQMLSSVVPAMMIALFLTLVARPFAVFVLLTPFKASFAQQTLVSWAGLRGAASIVFAIIAYTSPAYTETDIFHIVFCIVLFSILIQGSFIPLFAKWLNMIDTNEDVLKTFTDYSEEIPIQFIQFEIKHSHPWAEKQIKDVVLPPGTLIVLQKRKNKNIAPRGFSVIKPGDVLVLSASAFENIDGVSLSEIIIDRRSKWLNKALSEIDLDSDKLVIMIMRGKKTIIPQGNTVLRQGDIMVINTTV